jgi:hypothetical protein
MALFRVLMGVLLLVDLAIRSVDLNAMYTDAGMFPRVDICQGYNTIWNWSFHFGSGSWGYQAVLFGFAAVMALALLVGVETRLATIGCWLMLLSVQHRVPPILSGADILFRMLLFWGMFLPLGRVWSVDCWLENRRRLETRGEPGRFLSVASSAILLQIGLVYLFSAIYKSNVVWLRGEALAGVLQHDFFTSRFGAHLLSFPHLLTGLTWATFVLEWAAPLLLFSPWCTARLRLVLVAALAALHVGIGLCMEVGLFPFVSLAGLSLFLPSEFWNSHLLARFQENLQSFKQFKDAETSATKQRRPLSWATEGLCLVLLIYVAAVNLNTLPSHPLAPLEPDKWKPLATGCGLGQRWGMFELVPSNSGWYVARAKLNDGSEVDLLRQGAAIDWKKPPVPAEMYPNDRWRKLFREMAYYDELGFQVFRAPVAEFLCREWNARKAPERRIAEFEFVYCAESAAGTNSPTPQVVHERLVHLDLGGS